MNYDDYMGEVNENEISDGNMKIDELSLGKKQMPEFIAELRRDLNESRKNGQILRSENQALEHKTKEKCNEITKSVMDDLSNFEKEFKRVIQNDKTENEFLKQQIASLNQDKIKLQQSTISLDSRMKTCEVEVGVDYS